MDKVEQKVNLIAQLGFDEVKARNILKNRPQLEVEEVIDVLCGPGVAEQVEVIGPQPKPKSPPPIVDLTGPAPATPPAVAGVGGADDEMERAIQLSLKEADDREKFNQEIKGGRGYKEPENPFDRKRDSLEVPAGIKNVGNTCYINSLLQAIFMVPRFRTAILEFALVARETPGERLIHELQLLFTRMLLTERRYVDPQPLLEFTSHHGAQEDPTELFLSLLEKIREGILKHPTAKMARVSPAEDDVGTQPMDLREDVVEPDQEGSAGDLISRYFEGSCWQSVVAREEDGTPIERSTSEKFMQIICSVPQSNNLRLHDLLEHYTAVSLIDGYQTPRGHLTQARRSVMFDELPPILLIQLQRVSWTNNALQKNNAKVLFDDTMTMDRYLHVNEAATLHRRSVVGNWRDKLAQLQTELATIANFKGTNVAASDVLAHASSYLQETHPNEAHSVIASLQKFAEEARFKCGELAAKIAETIRQIERAYDDFPRESEYRLHAILVHSGSPDLGGHYWSYIRDHKSGDWFKFNDVTVNRVENIDDMFAQSFGDPAGATSAYALVYFKNFGEMEAWNTCQGVPLWARGIVNEDNVVFQHELQKWRIEHPLELSREEKQKNYEAGMADLLVPPHAACFKLSQYAYRREQPQRILELIVYSEVGLEPNERALDAEQNMIDALRKDFAEYTRLMCRLVQAIRHQPDLPLCVAYLASGCRDAHAQSCGQDLYKAAFRLLSTLASKVMFSVSSAVILQSAMDVRQKERLLMYGWDAAFYVQDAVVRKELMLEWKRLVPKLNAFEQVRQLVVNEKPPVLKLDEIPYTFDVCVTFNENFGAFVKTNSGR